MESRYLIVGLGNPGAEYAKTRHNAGFRLVERLARRWQAEWSAAKKFNALLAQARPGERRVVLCQPQTFMNASGEAVRAVMDYYDVARERLLVVVDDADLPLGELRLRGRGSSGGHHGLESVEQHLGAREFARLRIGIGRQASARAITDYVLGRFSAAEGAVLDEVLAAAGDQVECWLAAGIGKAMSQFNGVVGGSTNQEPKQ